MLAAVALTGLVGLSGRASAGAPPASKLAVALLPADETRGWGPIALSSDGRQLAFVAIAPDGRRRLYVRALDRPEARVLPGTEDARFPFWSPDGRSLGFFGDATMYRIDLAGGEPRALAPVADARGGTWNAEGTIVYTPNPGGGLYRVPAAGGTPVAISVLDPKRQETSHRWPSFLPDGKHVLILVRRPTDPERLTVEVVAIADGTRQRLLEAHSSAEFAGGRIYFVRETTLFAQDFDPATRKTSGEAVPLVEDIWRDSEMDGLTAFAAAAGGELAYRRGGFEVGQLTWFDRDGRKLRAVGSPGIYARPDLSPDGKQFTADLTELGRSNSRIVLMEEATGASTTLTFGNWNDSQPVWAPDGTRIAYSSDRKGPFDVYVRDIAGGGSEQRARRDASLEVSRELVERRPLASLPAGRSEDQGDLWVVPMDTAERTPAPYVVTPADEREARLFTGWTVRRLCLGRIGRPVRSTSNRIRRPARSGGSRARVARGRAGGETGASSTTSSPISS